MARTRPATSLIRIDKKQIKYPPYTQGQLKTVSSSSLFGKCNSEKPHLPGKARVRDWRYWIPLCALYSGARAGEIAQLLCADIALDDLRPFAVHMLEVLAAGGTSEPLDDRTDPLDRLPASETLP